MEKGLIIVMALVAEIYNNRSDRMSSGALSALGHASLQLSN